MFSSLLYKHLLISIDDLPLYANDIDTYLGKLAAFFSLFDQFGLKLNVKNSSLYQNEVKWCGRLIDGDGVWRDTETHQHYSCRIVQLLQFVCPINWMRESIVDFAQQVSPLPRRLDAALADTERTKCAVAGVKFELTQEERYAYDQVKEILSSSATLAFSDDAATTLLFTDANNFGWAIIVPQVMNFDSKTLVTMRHHTSSQLNWIVVEKEDHPIYVACNKLDYLLLRPKPFRMYVIIATWRLYFASDESVKAM
ncbi:Hypothetical protein PHPALM_17109 [Phytophthora palmivora]|uniref:Reverse transcriptase domain-containing protein n=1 Tax=Phytophthora palmivora TaxID=4796 RepID=A0A2P4XN35_9STRA|nr:Hypothetical protein PHPALM_17109 [Phytophthora palmivora]